MEKISVIIPYYNQSDYLLECIESVSKQSYPLFEILIIDDCSEEPVENILKFLKDSRIRLYKNAKKVGVACSRNRGLSVATGTYVQFLDADDILIYDKFEKQIELLKKEKSHVCVSDHFVFKNKSKDKRIVKNSFNVMNPIDELIQKWGDAINVPTSAFLFKKEAIDEINSYDESLPFLEDYDLILRLAINDSQFVYLDKVLCEKRTHDKSLSNSYLKTNELMLSILSKNYGLVSERLQEVVKKRIIQIDNDFDLQKLINESAKAGKKMGKEKNDYEFALVFTKDLYFAKDYRAENLIVVDITKQQALDESVGLTIYYGQQHSENILLNLENRYKDYKFDIIVDNGYNTGITSKICFDKLFEMVKEGGIYRIYGIDKSYIPTHPDGQLPNLEQGFINEKHIHSSFNGIVGFVKTLIDRKYNVKDIQRIDFSDEYVDIVKK
jgi:glycosyltransferase involved in cell wall biosynthesis